MATRKLRKDDLLGISLLDWEMKEVDLYDFSKAQQLPNYEYLFSRYYTILSEKNKLEKSRVNDATLQLSKEFHEIWITLNVYPIKLENIKRKFDLILKDFNTLVKRGDRQREKPWWKKKAQVICNSLQNGVDIITKDEECRKNLAKVYGVKMTAAEDALYKDNCVPIDDKESPNFGRCTRMRWSTDVDKNWLASANKRQKRIQAEHDREMRFKAANEKGESTDAVKETPSSSDDDDDVTVEKEEDEDLDYTPEKKNVLFEKTSHIFPEIPARYSYKEFNLDLIEIIAQVECRFEVPANRSRELVAFVLNSAAGQHLEVPSEEEEEREEKETSSDEVERKRRKFECKSNVMCSRTTMRKYIADAGMLNLTYAAEKIKKSNECGSVVTVGWDDTLKKGGNRLWDIKTGHVTIIDGEKKRSTLSLGFQQNISHKGEDSAEGVRSTISKLAKATESTFDEALAYIDFHMTDRAGDADKMLDELEIDGEKRLKCNAHPTLAVGEAIDKTFRDVEAAIGTEKLICTGAAHCFNSPKSSVWYLGLIAVAKALSPSHATEGISLFKDYKNFLEKDATSESETSNISKSLLKSGFKGFSSNRFGRIGELSSMMKKHMDTVIRFFDECVDENSNKLSLAISAYVSSEWFKACINIGAYFDDLILDPLKEALGIDEYATKKSKYRSWDGLRLFFNEKLEKLKSMSLTENEGKEKLMSDVAKNIHEALTRQLENMTFYKENEKLSEGVKKKMKFTPLTNSGCESNFGDVTETLKKTGGSTNIEKLSDMHIVKKNKLFESKEWESLTDEDKKARWKQARSGETSKEIRKIGEDFLKKVEGMKQMAAEGKKAKKIKKNERALKLLDACKEHGGPVTMANISELEHLTEKQLVTEVCYLRSTIAPNIRQKRKEEGKFINFSKSELISQIKNVIHPLTDLSKDVNSLLSDVYHARFEMDK